ncbi:unnamed protein product [Vicia faba]|uniref:CCHC-type domain-containing protein n=1 Tax=Vicia faba TaxID=3906 RepID=A0AAV1APV0_VICFA|nr:unnamed protein product [Vicia faba]
MDKWKSFALSKEEEEGVVADEEEIIEDESMQRTLAGKLWTESSFNTRAFKNTMLNAWKLKLPVEIQYLIKNLFIFKFGSKRDMEFVLKSGPWSFDRVLLVLNRISREEQPLYLNLHSSSFWVRIYDLPLMLRYESMAKKLGNIIGSFEEMDVKEAHRNGRFLRIKVSVDLKEPLKREAMVTFKERKIRVHFKYERLSTFCFVCGRMGHQIKDCKAVENLNEEGFEELEEQDLAFWQWLWKDRGEDLEVQQGIMNSTLHKGSESLGEVALTIEKAPRKETSTPGGVQKKKWTRRKTVESVKTVTRILPKPKANKRHLVDTMIVEGNLDECGVGEKKRKQTGDVSGVLNNGPELVLEDQHRLPQ